LLGGFSPYTYVAQASERKLDYDYDVWQLGYTHRFDEASDLSIQAGKNNTSSQNLTRAHFFDDTYNEFAVNSWMLTETEQASRLYSISYKQKSEISSIEFSFGRNRVASSTGGLNETDTARLNYFSDITERLSWSLGINRVNSKPDENTNVLVSNELTRTNVEPSAYYKLGRDWSLSLGLRYSELDTETAVQPAEAKAVFFTMSWREPKLLSTN